MDTSQVGTGDAEQGNDSQVEVRTPHTEPVLVRFNPGTNRFDFEPETVDMDRPGKIVILKDPPKNRTWSLKEVTITDQDDQFTIEARSGVAIVVDDKCTTDATYCYTVTVVVHGSGDEDDEVHTSPDPHIRNSNPTAGEPPGD